jgi:hypothetical protein
MSGQAKRQLIKPAQKGQKKACVVQAYVMIALRVFLIDRL